MKIILISMVANLGKIGEIVTVKNGYAKNFLIPQKKAIIYNSGNSKLFESKRQEFEAENLKNLSSAEKIKEQIIGKDIVIIENASDDGHLYGSVNSAIIATKINEILGQKILTRSNIFLTKPIKEIGLYDITLSFHFEVNAVIRLIVTRSESEIETLINAKNKKNHNSDNHEENATNLSQEPKKEARKSDKLTSEKSSEKKPARQKKN
jgi:large subunit ribosomal protein L9